MKKRLLATVVAAMLCTVPTVQAQWVVIDPTNLVQNTLTAIRTLEQINNQIQQLQNEAQMLANQARNLASLPFNVVNRLRSNLALTHRERRPDVPRCTGALEEHATRPTDHHADAGPGVAEPE